MPTDWSNWFWNVGISGIVVAVAAAAGGWFLSRRNQDNTEMTVENSGTGSAIGGNFFHIPGGAVAAVAIVAMVVVGLVSYSSTADPEVKESQVASPEISSSETNQMDEQTDTSESTTSAPQAQPQAVPANPQSNISQNPSPEPVQGNPPAIVSEAEPAIAPADDAKATSPAPEPEEDTDLGIASPTTRPIVGNLRVRTYLTDHWRIDAPNGDRCATSSWTIRSPDGSTRTEAGSPGTGQCYDVNHTLLTTRHYTAPLTPGTYTVTLTLTSPEGLTSDLAETTFTV